MDIDYDPSNYEAASSSSAYPPGDYEMGSVIQGDGMVNNLDFHR